jgi:hypothetical protein
VIPNMNYSPSTGDRGNCGVCALRAIERGVGAL